MYSPCALIVNESFAHHSHIVRRRDTETYAYAVATRRRWGFPKSRVAYCSMTYQRTTIDCPRETLLSPQARVKSKSGYPLNSRPTILILFDYFCI